MVQTKIYQDGRFKPKHIDSYNKNYLNEYFTTEPSKMKTER